MVLGKFQKIEIKRNISWHCLRFIHVCCTIFLALTCISWTTTKSWWKEWRFFYHLAYLFVLNHCEKISSFSVFCSVIQVNGHCLKFVFTVRFKALFIFQKALILQKTSLLQLILNQDRSDLYELQVRSNKNKLLKWELLCQPWKSKNPAVKGAPIDSHLSSVQFYSLSHSN